MALQQIQTHRYTPDYGTGQVDAINALAGISNKIEDNRKDKIEAEQKERLLAKDEYEEARDTFNIPAEEGDTADISAGKIAASNDLANEAAELSRQYRKGSITLEDFKAGEAKLIQALGGITHGDAYINGQATTYQEMSLTPDSISNATSPEAIAVSRGIADGKITMGWNAESNRLEYRGTYQDAEGNDVDIKDIPVGKENRFPRNVRKADDPSNAFFDLNVKANKDYQETSTQDGIETTGNSWNDAHVQRAYDTKIKEMVGNSDQLLSIATDHLGISREEAYALMNEKVDSGGNALQEQVTEALKEQAKEQFFGNEKGRVAASETLRLRKEQLATSKKGNNIAAKVSEGDKKFNRSVTDAKHVLSLAEDAISSDNYQNLTRLPGIAKVKQSGDKVYLYGKDGAKRVELPKDEAGRRQVLQNFLGVSGSILEALSNDDNEQNGPGGVDYSSVSTSRN